MSLPGVSARGWGWGWGGVEVVVSETRPLLFPKSYSWNWGKTLCSWGTGNCRKLGVRHQLPLWPWEHTRAEPAGGAAGHRGVCDSHGPTFFLRTDSVSASLCGPGPSCLIHLQGFPGWLWPPSRWPKTNLICIAQGRLDIIRGYSGKQLLWNPLIWHKMPASFHILTVTKNKLCNMDNHVLYFLKVINTLNFLS